VQIKRCAPLAAKVALMADHHQGYAVPIGGVVAYRDMVSPSGVGFDIACGNKAVRLDVRAVEVKRKINKLMDDVYSKLSFGIGQINNIQVEHELFDDDAWRIFPCSRHKQMAENQLGTIGSGNHYVDLFVDELDRVWVGVHFGSRGLGHKIASHFITAGGGKEGIHVDPVLLHDRSDLGEQYLACMKLAGRYAYAGRDWVCEKVARILKAHIVEEVHNHHNFAWRENHDGEDLWVIRKGATPAFPGQKGFVGGSMGDISIRRGERIALLDGPRRGPCDVAHAGRREAQEGAQNGRFDQPFDDGTVGARQGRDLARGRNRRIAALLQAPARGAGAPRGVGADSAHAHADRGGDGGRRRLRPVQGLSPTSLTGLTSRTDPFGTPASSDTASQ
jgi:hypothetical protein